MRKTQRLFCLVAGLLLLLAAACCALADSPFDDESVHVSGDVYRVRDFLYRVLDNGTAEIVEYVGPDSVEEIPAVLAGYPVSAIGEKAFSNEGWIHFYTDEYPDYLRENIHRIHLPEGITRIGAYAFEQCFNLNEVTFPSTLTEIGEGAFDQCERLMCADLPDHLVHLGAYAFRGCHALTSARLPESLTDIGANPYADCWYLQRFEISPAHPFLRYADGFLTDTRDMRLIACTGEAAGETAVIPEGILIIGDSALAGAPFTSIRIPASVREIGRYAFADCIRLTELEIPETVTEIGDNPIRGCTELKALRIADGQRHFTVRGGALVDEREARLIACLIPVPLAEIHKDPPEDSGVPAEAEAYGLMIPMIGKAGSYWLEEPTDDQIPPLCTVPDGIEVIGDGAFYGAVVREIVLPESVRQVGCEAFAMCGYLKTCRLPDHLTRLPDRLFYGCERLESLSIPACAESIGAYALAGTALPEIVLPDSVKEIGPYVFADSADDVYVSVVLSEAITEIPKGAFRGCGISEIRLPQGITAIGEEAFARTRYLETFEMPAGMTSVAEFCFFDSAIRSIVFPPQLEYIGDQAFRVDDYHSGLLEDLGTLPDSLRYIGRYAFRNQSALAEVTLPGGILRMGEGVFHSAGLERAILADGIRELPAWMFMYSRLEEVRLPDSLSRIGEGAFANCGISDIRLPGGELHFGGNPFVSMRAAPDIHVGNAHPNLRLSGNLLIDESEHRLIACIPAEGETNCTVPEGIVSIGRSAFEDLKLTEIILPESLRLIEDYAFCRCYDLESIRLPDLVERIGAHAFEGCEFKEIRLPPHLKEIGAYALSCPTIEEIMIPESVERIGRGALAAGKVTFPNSPVILEGCPFYDEHVEIILPSDHPTLMLDGGSLYSADGRELFALLTDAPVRDGTEFIGDGAVRMRWKGMMILPASVRLIILDGWAIEYGLYPQNIYAVPGSPSEGFFKSVIGFH
ncbi:MAG: leucine-rich repeat protein [Clostridia bacterium]|nr:leucine-rich repeat protein [Clostridia bacterium]